MQLAKLLEGLNCRIKSDEQQADLDVLDIAYDSRKAKPGCLFVSISGLTLNGREFINDAVRAGARVVVHEDPPEEDLPLSIAAVEVENARTALSTIAANYYANPSLELCLVGVTGTNGKTTLTFLLESIFRQADKSTGVIGTIAYKFANSDVKASHTTPESLDLQRLLRLMVDQKVTHVAMEVSSHALELGRVGNTHFDVAVLTNITQDHLDFHRDMQTYLAAKERLFHQLQAGLKQDRATAVINGDDPYSKEILERLQSGNKVRSLSFGLTETNDFFVKSVDFTEQGFSAEIGTPDGVKEISSKLAGQVNLQNCLAACAAAYAVGIDWQAIVAGIANLDRVPGRLDQILNDRAVDVFIDYAHTSDAIANVLKALKLLRDTKESQPGRIITVFGCGGDRDRKKRPLMGGAALQGSDAVIVTSDNPRTEDPMQIIADIMRATELKQVAVGAEEFVDKLSKVSAGSKQKVAAIVENRRAAIQLALESAQPSDMVLIAGKGHEDYQEINGVRQPFDDRQVAIEIMESMGWKITSA